MGGFWRRRKLVMSGAAADVLVALFLSVSAERLPVDFSPEKAYTEFVGPQPVYPHVSEVELAPEVQIGLSLLWEESVRTGVEQIRCLEGEIRNGTARIENLAPVRVTGASHTGVKWDLLSCMIPGFLGSVHTHPGTSGYPVCRHSDADRRTFAETRTAMLAMVLCMPSRATWIQKTAPEIETTLTW